MTFFPKGLNAFNLSEWLSSESDKPIIIDVRENIEIKLASFPYTNIHIPLSMLSIDNVSKILENYKNKKFVILCHKGIRSYDFGMWLLENNFVKEVWNLNEGIDGWSRYIDPKIPRY